MQNAPGQAGAGASAGAGWILQCNASLSCCHLVVFAVAQDEVVPEADLLLPRLLHWLQAASEGKGKGGDPCSSQQPPTASWGNLAGARRGSPAAADRPLALPSVREVRRVAEELRELKIGRPAHGRFVSSRPCSATYQCRRGSRVTCTVLCCRREGAALPKLSSRFLV